MPRRRPADSIINHVLKIYAKQKRTRELERKIIELLRTTAMHEAAHAVAAYDRCDGFKFVTILGNQNSDGWCRFIVNRPHIGFDRALGSLAGPAVECVFNPDAYIDDFSIVYEYGNDFRLAAECFETVHQAAAYPDEVIAWVTAPHVWWRIMYVADALLRHGTVMGDILEDVPELKDDKWDKIETALDKVRSALIVRRPLKQAMIDAWYSLNEDEREESFA